jgi:hypothetical protein
MRSETPGLYSCTALLVTAVLTHSHTFIYVYYSPFTSLDSLKGLIIQYPHQCHETRKGEVYVTHVIVDSFKCRVVCPVSSDRQDHSHTPPTPPVPPVAVT